jgi:hypothetical protein
MKSGRKSAVRLFDDEEMALAGLSMLNKDHKVVKRIGQSIRCESYCPVSAFCRQRAAMLEAQNESSAAA